MSLCRDILLFSLFFITYQTVKSENDTDTLALEAVNFNLERKNGSLILKINNMEKEECMATRSPPDLNRAEKELTAWGDSKNYPVNSCSEVDESGKKYINESLLGLIRFQCDVENKATCLIVKSNIKENEIKKSSITVDEDHLWLSQTKFGVKLLYNDIGGSDGTNHLQINHLLSKSVKVIQTIRFYYSSYNNSDLNSTTSVNDARIKAESLTALSWNDHLIGSKVTKQMPMTFTLNKTEICWAGNLEWMCTNIEFESKFNYNRLPVKDFYIGDILTEVPSLEDAAASGAGATLGKTVHKVYFELDHLCFYNQVEESED